MRVADAEWSLAWLERVNRLALASRLLAGTIHELNNALQVISGSAEMLEQLAGEQATRRGRAMAAQAARATTALADLSAFVRDDRTEVGPVRLRQMAERALAVRGHALQKQRIVSSIEGDDLIARASTRRVLQVLLNLVINAEHALRDCDDPRLSMTIGAADKRVELVVEDNGPGLAGLGEAQIFKPRPATDCPLETLGIGLFVSSWLAAEQGGSLTHAPSPDGGSRFALALPIADR